MSVVKKTPIVAADVMQTKLITIGPEALFRDAIAKLLRSNVSGLPIVDSEGHYRGMFSEKCGLRMLHQHPTTICADGGQDPIAHEVMTTKLVLLREEQDVFDGIAQLTKHRVSGAPVLDSHDRYVGVFSEKTSMSVLAQCVTEGIQSAWIGSFTNRDSRRVVDQSTPLNEIVRTFVETEFRRLPVIHGGHAVGQVSRRDVLKHPGVYRRMIELNAEDLGGNDHVLSLSDTTAKTISPNLDLLSIIGIFLSSPFRRLPVLEDDKLVGQISRRDVLQAVLQQCETATDTYESASLYLSALGVSLPGFH